MNKISVSLMTNNGDINRIECPSEGCTEILDLNEGQTRDMRTVFVQCQTCGNKAKIFRNGKKIKMARRAKKIKELKGQ